MSPHFSYTLLNYCFKIEITLILLKNYLFLNCHWAAFLQVFASFGSDVALKFMLCSCFVSINWFSWCANHTFSPACVNAALNGTVMYMLSIESCGGGWVRCQSEIIFQALACRVWQKAWKSSRSSLNTKFPVTNRGMLTTRCEIRRKCLKWLAAIIMSR
jgi:hypothetical protein